MWTFPLDFPFGFICIFLQQHKQLPFINHGLRAKHCIEGFLYISSSNLQNNSGTQILYSFVGRILSIESDTKPNSSWFKQRKRMNYLVSVENHEWHQEGLPSCPPHLVSFGSTPPEEALIRKQKGFAAQAEPSSQPQVYGGRGGSHKP